MTTALVISVLLNVLLLGFLLYCLYYPDSDCESVPRPSHAERSPPAPPAAPAPLQKPVELYADFIVDFFNLDGRRKPPEFIDLSQGHGACSAKSKTPRDDKEPQQWEFMRHVRPYDDG